MRTPEFENGLARLMARGSNWSRNLGLMAGTPPTTTVGLFPMQIVQTPRASTSTASTTTSPSKIRRFSPNLKRNAEGRISF
jgi:hypothetical protein